MRRREDSNYDILALSANMTLENNSDRDVVFYVRKAEVDHSAISAVVVDGQVHPFKLHDGYLNLDLAIPAGQVRSVAVKYEEQLSSGSVSVEKKSIRVYLLREASDFRDDFLYKWSVGRALVRFYYKHDATPTEALLCASGLMASCAYAAWVLPGLIRRSYREKRATTT
jgi:hypothetical protein